MARRGQRRQTGDTRTAQRSNQRGGQRNNQRRNRPLDNDGIIPVLARAVREVEIAVQKGSVQRPDRTKFQVVALLVREERARIKADTETTEAKRADELKRLDGIATILAKTTARDTSLLELLTEEASVSDAARALKREMLEAAGLDVPPEEVAAPEPALANGAHTERRVVPQSVISRQLSNPFLVPDFSTPAPVTPKTHRLASWELLGPLFRSFEYGGASSCMDLPEPSTLKTASGMELMHHQGEVVAAAAEGHRTFLLADEPGLGKTAQALLAAQAAEAYPLLVVVPSVVKTNWAREAEIWTPKRPTTVIHGDGDTIDGFADIVIVNYEVLDRHVGWLGDFGFRGMVIDEAHFIKNKSSQRSQHALEIADRIRARTPRPLMMALTGTPLINDIEDFRAIWQFLGWIDDKKPRPGLMAALEETGLSPVDSGFYAAARAAVIDQGIVRRRKVDVASDIPARRVADLPVELDDALGRSIRDSERKLAKRLLKRYQTALETRTSGVTVEGIDHELVRRVATWEREDNSDNSSGENVFTMMRRIGQAKAGLAADYAAQLARNVGKVVFFAKHIDVMDVAQETFAKRDIRYASIRGDQTPRERQKNIDAFINDPDVAIVVCSLTAAGVGLNLQVASNMVLAELSWTDAEQTQAIDRIHRIGQAEPVTAWRIIASQTLDTKIAELIDSKAGLAARALDGSDEEIADSSDVQLEALVALLTDELERLG
ncbi:MULTISPECIES: DEAD/DEAH box helicase [unclassified Nocardioides]|uniref:DEAD/DEAH box helicase n=1 Tax=unclassified Nocardioides TaxID=2615069 RepID=UPI0006F6C184|nr:MULTISPECIES: DEAD/DEAH box helicase [unclassified Nocardioides]KQY56774.1 helicase [Nocardioides sp. Root140]KQZ67030.1 helicase [Nocardioides sp. Root151]KRF12894.1 helicase [Nocardioides sp. Soil796]